jgi:hypothetical protein
MNSMNDRRTAEDFDTAVRMSQITVLSLAAGVCAFAAFAIVAGGGGERPGALGANFGTLMLGLAGLAVIVRCVVPPLVVAQARNRLIAGDPSPALPAPQDDETKRSLAAQLQPVYLSTNTLAASILEAGALANVLAFWVERHWVHLAVATVLLVAILIPFPSRSSAQRWLDKHSRLVEEARELRGRRDG